ncbi:hypothetical protein C8A03DRAFT_47709 [Achaetomium macrosporum]|uniref:Heterokaryon incompatibility domain-containing protein n=1 Tax=Achaetomium macrosporum TaxID=79813 RepID=A0AAN7C1X1_9PEZI|nr:hypothetical protein C8A03DRAFT_47709 [Achaetomium macrosporum]
MLGDFHPVLVVLHCIAGYRGWSSLVRRSLEAWPDPDMHRLAKSFLETCANLDDLLHLATEVLMFWFFQRRDAFLGQKTMTKWSPDRLDDYVLFPASNGFVTRSECFFVSHFWHSKDDPDPGGKYSRLLQRDLEQQEWSYIWVDWTCLPQLPRTETEKGYFFRGLSSIPAIIRNCGFIWYYPPFEPRLWILYEIAEYSPTCSGDPFALTSDIKKFAEHVDEMYRVGVRSTLDRHGYRCSYDRDKEFLTSRLELLVLLKRLRLNILDLRKLMDDLTWFPTALEVCVDTASGFVKLRRFEGRLTLDGKLYTFTPFPTWSVQEEGRASEVRQV